MSLRLPLALALTLASIMLRQDSAHSQEAELFAFSEAARGALASAKINDRGLAIAELAASPSQLAPLVLNALLAGDLYAAKNGGSIYIAKEKDSTPVDLLTGAAVEAAARGGLRKITLNNKQRQEIGRILNSLSLRGGDAEKRRAATAALLDAATPGLDAAALKDLLAWETDAGARENLKAALALITVQNPASPRAELLDAIGALAGSGQNAARKALTELSASPDPAVAKAAENAMYWLRVGRDWASFVETLFFGLSLGSILVLAAIGLAITFGVMGVINMAHGELIMIGAYTAWLTQILMPGNAALALILAVPAAFLASGGIGAILEVSVIRFLYGRPLETLLATFGISLILQQAVRSLFSPLNRAVENPAFMSGMWRITQNFSITRNRFYIVIFSLGVFAAIYGVMRWTRLGLEVRAVSQNRAIARALGVRAARVDALTFGLGSGIAGIAGVALSQITNVGPNLGQAYIVYSFMVVVFGGVGNLWGTMIGGLMLGVANKFLEPLSGAMLSKIFILVFIILFIQKRPRGLFPQRGRAAEG